MESISVIIPTYNEEPRIGALLDQLVELGADEILVVDGGSTDRTVEVASKSARVMVSPAGRAVQMNAGARAASGDVLLFVHADSRFGPTALISVKAAMRDRAVPGGNLDIIFEGGDAVARVFTWIYHWRRRLGIFYGDSAIFCRRSVFEHLGGYKPWPVLEDYEFARRLWKLRPLALLDEPVWSSDRRWKNDGLVKTLLNWVWIQGSLCRGCTTQAGRVVPACAVMRPVIILFAKAPAPGRVKTRLCPFLDAASAAALHSAFVRDTLEMLAKLSDVADIELSTDIETDAWREFDVVRSRQAEGGLGERLQHALEKAFGAGRPRAMVVGSDSPGLPAEHVEGLLRSNLDATLGPTEDGGFYAVACRRTAPEMFRGVRWSTANTLADTSRAMRACGLTMELGRPWFDIDQPADLLRLRSVAGLPRHTARWLASKLP